MKRSNNMLRSFQETEDAEIKKILRSNLTTIIKEIDPRGHILDVMYQEKVINSVERRHEIEHCRTGPERSRALMNYVLETSNPKAGKAFLSALAEEYGWIYEDFSCKVDKVLCSSKEKKYDINLLPPSLNQYLPRSKNSADANYNQATSGAPLNPIADQYNNPKDFDLNPSSARFFVIKSYYKENIYNSIKYSIWCSTEVGNKRLDSAYREREGKGPIYLFFSVNASGCFCGMAQMTSAVDYNSSSNVWAEMKWKGQFEVKWIYVKDVPTSELCHITLANNEGRPVTMSWDTQEVYAQEGMQVLHIIDQYLHTSSILDDYTSFHL